VFGNDSGVSLTVVYVRVSENQQVAYWMCVCVCVSCVYKADVTELVCVCVCGVCVCVVCVCVFLNSLRYTTLPLLWYSATTTLCQ